MGDMTVSEPGGVASPGLSTEVVGVTRRRAFSDVYKRRLLDEVTGRVRVRLA